MLFLVTSALTLFFKYFTGWGPKLLLLFPAPLPLSLWEMYKIVPGGYPEPSFSFVIYPTFAKLSKFSVSYNFPSADL